MFAKIIFTALISSLGLNAMAALSSPFASTVQGLDIANAHIVAEAAGTVVRGSAPLGKVDELKELNITDVLIFKNEVKDEVQQEISELTAAGYSSQNIHNIAFPWHDIHNFHQACEQTLSALKILRKAYETNNRAVYFHCTVGEDRTGLLAGLFSQLATGDRSLDVFQNELCAKGYEAGDHKKPQKVVEQVRRNLTPIFVFLSSQIESQGLRVEDLDQLSCDGLEQHLSYDSQFTCQN